jgi:hypothetical protein
MILQYKMDRSLPSRDLESTNQCHYMNWFPADLQFSYNDEIKYIVLTTDSSLSKIHCTSLKCVPGHFKCLLLGKHIYYFHNNRNRLVVVFLCFPTVGVNFL